MPHNARVFEGCVSTMLDPYLVLDFTDERGERGPMLLGSFGVARQFFVVGGAYGVLVLRLSVDGALCVAGLGWSLAIGAIGASVPAGRAVYMNVAATSREA